MTYFITLISRLTNSFHIQRVDAKFWNNTLQVKVESLHEVQKLKSALTADLRSALNNTTAADCGYHHVLQSIFADASLHQTGKSDFLLIVLSIVEKVMETVISYYNFTTTKQQFENWQFLHVKH